MKSIKLFIMLLSLFLITGCENQSLECSKEEKLDTGVSVEKQAFLFKNDKIDEYSTSIELKLNSEYKKYKDILFNTFESSFMSFKGKKGLEYKVIKNDDNIIITIGGKYGEMNNEVKENLGISNHVSYEKTLKALEKDGYSCKH